MASRDLVSLEQREVLPVHLNVLESRDAALEEGDRLARVEVRADGEVGTRISSRDRLERDLGRLLLDKTTLRVRLKNDGTLGNARHLILPVPRDRK